MAVERKFIEDNILKYGVASFLEKELDRAGFSRVEIQRTPMVTRIFVEVENPGKVIGKKGKTINDLTEAVHTRFKLENPQISVAEIKVPELEPRLMAKRVVKMLEMGKHARRILHGVLRSIMLAGALGAEINAAGAIGAAGGRARHLRVAAGYIPKAGEPTRLVHEARVTAYPKLGAIGVHVRIVWPGTEFPDKKIIKPVELPAVIAAAALPEAVMEEPKQE